MNNGPVIVQLNGSELVYLEKNNGENLSLLLDCVRSAVYVGTIAFFWIAFDQRCMSALLLATFAQVVLPLHWFTWPIAWLTLMLLLLLLWLWLWCPYAKACCGIAKAAAVIATAATIAAIAKVVFLWFICSQSLFSIIVYLNCFTTTANTIGEIVDIFELW
jgi:hypothetical protein